MKKRIEQKLQEILQPSFLQVINESDLHIGHMGHNINGESHFKIRINSHKLQQTSRIEAHRIINKILQEEFNKNGLHALSIELVSLI